MLGHLVSLHAKWQGVLAAHCLMAADQASLWSPAQAILLQPGPACSPWSLRSGDSGDRSFRGRTVIADPRVTGPLGCPWRTFLGHWIAQRLELKLLSQKGLVMIPGASLQPGARTRREPPNLTLLLQGGGQAALVSQGGVWKAHSPEKGQACSHQTLTQKAVGPVPSKAAAWPRRDAAWTWSPREPRQPVTPLCTSPRGHPSQALHRLVRLGQRHQLHPGPEDPG